MNTDAPTGSRLWTVSAAARARGVYARRLWAAIRTGRLPAFQVGHWLRVRLEDVDAWIDTQRYDTNQKSGINEAPRRESRVTT